MWRHRRSTDETGNELPVRSLRNRVFKNWISTIPDYHIVHGKGGWAISEDGDAAEGSYATRDAMPTADRELPQPPVMEQPRCPGCGSPMNLARASQDRGGFVLRNFECPTCEPLERWVRKEACAREASTVVSS